MINKDVSNSIDVIRGLSALGVIYGHSVYGFKLPLELNGAFWVWIFLPISGYLIGKGFADHHYDLNITGYARFLWNRGLRIIPLYQLAIVIGWVLERISHKAETSGVNAVQQFFFMAKHTTLSGPLWTVVAEVHFYIISILIVYCVIKLRKRFWLHLLIWVASLVIAAIYIRLFNDMKIQPRTFIGNLHFFVFGLIIALGSYEQRLIISRKMQISLVIGFITLAWALNNYKASLFWGTGGLFKHLPISGGSLSALAITFFILCSNIADSGAGNMIQINGAALLGTRFLCWCGVHTYGIYVWHSVIGKLNNVMLHVPIGAFRLLMFLLLSLPMAMLSYRYFEKPLLKYKSKHIRVKQENQFSMLS
jgi:peptidoglycan/LPS O-acetylase OafA/YrhL